MTISDEFTEALIPLAHDGNPEAARALCRLMVADDPDAEARAVIAETSAMVQYMYDELRPIIDWLAALQKDTPPCE